jgi:hypothetical protein
VSQLKIESLKTPRLARVAGFFHACSSCTVEIDDNWLFQRLATGCEYCRFAQNEQD